MTQAGVDFSEIEKWRKELDKIERKFPGAKRKAEVVIAKEVAAEARAFARGTGPMQAHFAGSIYGSATPQGAAIGVRHDADAAFWGAKKHTGWYAGKPGPAQFPEWIGNDWDVGKLGEGPLAINPTIFHEGPNIEKRYGHALDEAASGAFNERK